MLHLLLIVFLILNVALACWNIHDGDYYLLPINAVGIIACLLGLYR